MAMKKSELRELYLMMFPEYPDIVNITQPFFLVQTIGGSKMEPLWTGGENDRPENRKCFPDTQGQCH